MALKKITVCADLQYMYLWLKVVNSLQLKMTTVYCDSITSSRPKYLPYILQLLCICSIKFNAKRSTNPHSSDNSMMVGFFFCKPIQTFLWFPEILSIQKFSSHLVISSQLDDISSLSHANKTGNNLYTRSMNKYF